MSCSPSIGPIDPILYIPGDIVQKLRVHNHSNLIQATWHLPLFPLLVYGVDTLLRVGIGKLGSVNVAARSIILIGVWIIIVVPI